MEMDIKIVKEYLTYAQIQQICDATLTLETWSEREENIDMLVMLYTTDAGLDKLKKLGHDNLLAAGVVDMVRSGVKNFDRIYDAIRFTESPLHYADKLIKLLQSDKAQALIKQYAGVKK